MAPGNLLKGHTGSDTKGRMDGGKKMDTEKRQSGGGKRDDREDCPGENREITAAHTQ